MKKLILVLLLVALTTNAQEFQGPENLSLGGAGIATNNNSDGHWVNPATLGFTRGSIFGVYFGSGGGMPASKPFSGWAVSTIDSHPSKEMPGAFTFSRYDKEVDGRSTFLIQDFQYALAYMLRPRLAMGVTGKYSILEDRRDASIRFYNFNSHIGIMGAPAQNIAIGIVYHNAIDNAEDIPLALRPIPALGVGGNVSFLEVFRLRFDWVSPRTQNPENLSDVRVGLESSVKRYLSLRVGYAWQETKKVQEISGGLAFLGPKLSVAYGLAQTRTNYLGSANRAVVDGQRHVFDLWLPF